MSAKLVETGRFRYGDPDFRGQNTFEIEGDESLWSQVVHGVSGLGTVVSLTDAARNGIGGCPISFSGQGFEP